MLSMKKTSDDDYRYASQCSKMILMMFSSHPLMPLMMLSSLSCMMLLKNTLLVKGEC
jgi:hypothetical protein